ncbi:serine hydrolase domain-containing protein [Streptomyces sp. NPDC059166]|uniref:serine hydrolase domain-containing protein n=1 Tax=Streptomyces sp. NPDC059166 TaxID=3346752 RepID=UPI0036BB0976
MSSSDTAAAGWEDRAPRSDAELPSDLGGRFVESFRPVVEAFADTVADPESSGAALAIRHRGVEVVNVWRGVADARDGRAWDERTPSVLFSSTKGLASLTVAWLVEQGRIDLETPVAECWPEFGVHDKQALTVGDLLAHRAGLYSPDEDITLDEVLDGRAFAARLAAQKPRWIPGEAHLYHGVTWGPLVRETVLRATGLDLPAVFREMTGTESPADITLQATDAEIARVTHLRTSPEHDVMGAKMAEMFAGDAGALRFFTTGGAFPLGYVTEDGGLNDPRVQKAGLVSATGIGTAAALARVWSSAITPTDGQQRLLSDRGVALLTRERSGGPGAFDANNAGPFHRWGAGVQLFSDALPLLTKDSFGHDGAGGQAGFADPQHQVGFGYLTNRMEVASNVPRVVAALSEVLSDLPTDAPQ